MKGALLVLVAMCALFTSSAFAGERTFDCKVYKDGTQIAEKTGSFEKHLSKANVFEFTVFQDENLLVLYRPNGYAGPVGKIGQIFFQNKKTGLIAFSKSNTTTADSLILINGGIGWQIACEQGS